MGDQELNLGHLAEEFAKLLVDVPRAATAEGAPVRLEEGERREVTVLFLDLVGYTRLAERLDPEQLKFVVSNTLQVFTNQVKKYGGTVEKFIGDAIMALFGRQQAHEDDSRRTVAAAHAILDRLEDINSILAQRGIKLHARIGINRGLVVTGQLAEHETVTGEALNIAQRLEANAPEDGILISESVYKDCHPYYRCEELPPLLVKNKTEPLTVYRVWEELPQLHRAARPGAGPFVGREGELTTMRMLWERTLASQLSILQITGEAGIGKSRLVQEFIGRIGAQQNPPPVVTYLTAESFGQPPYHVLSDLIREYLEQAKMGLEAFVTEIGDDSLRGGIQEYQVHLRDLIGLPLATDEQAALEVMEPRARQAEMLLALKRFLAGAIHWERQRGVPAMIVVVDNQQWVSHASRDALGQILQSVPANRPLLWIFVGRPAEVGQWFPATISVTTLNLPALPMEAVEELIRIRLPHQELTAPFCRQVMERTGGSPLFLSEVLVALARVGELAHFTLEELLPGSIKALVLSRLDQLPRQKKFTLQVAAVAGREFSLPLLSHVLERVGYSFDANQLTQELIDQELLAPSDSAYAIAQPMVAEVAYTTILYANRRKLHGIVARFVEGGHMDNLRPYAAYLAEQWGRAGETGRAIGHYLEAGFAARARYAYRDGVSFFERGRQLLRQMMTQAGEWTAGSEEETLVEEAEATVRVSGAADQVERLGLIYVALGHFYEALSNSDARERLIRDGIAVLPAEHWAVAALKWQAAFLQYERGDMAGGEKQLRELLAAKAVLQFPDIVIECHLLLGMIAWERGDVADREIETALKLRPIIEERIRQSNEAEALDRYRAAFDHSIMYKIDYNVFNHYKNNNALTKAEEYFHRVLEPTGARHNFAQHMVHLFYCSLMWDRGVEFSTIAMRAALARAYFREIGWARGVGWGAFYRGAALWRLGQFVEAHQVFTETLQYLERYNDAFMIGKMELLLTAVLLARGDTVGYQLRKGRLLKQAAASDPEGRPALKREFAIFEGQCALERHELNHIYEELMETTGAPLPKVEADECGVTIALVAAQLGHAEEAAKRLAEARSSVEQNQRKWLAGLVARADGILAAQRREIEQMNRHFAASVVRFQEVGAQFDCHLSYQHWWRALEHLGIEQGPRGQEVRQGLAKWQPAATGSSRQER
ncbi:MAG: AAA family ATPase [Deltaproteobacteria bacterium]|nr:AAA family ATPase [Deltaproteobacteria bacterium]